MRPLSLTVSGLQSFRDEETIPFEELCSGGVFGIFGPTGSGKSTILDAVTLALYGKVERAASGTYGIMNQSEDKLSVSFSFSLGQGDQQKSYKVERSYKRTGEYTIRTSTSRLIEFVEGKTIVLADKEREVTKLVSELIGLTIEDFTRAVVLPQGKFAEFLSLKGADRRQMLQRLFQLEKYGDVLNQKLKKRADGLKNRQSEIVAEQAGLGDSSADTLKEAQNQLKEYEQKLVDITDNCKQEEKQFNDLKQFYEIQQENNKLLAKEAELKQQLPEMTLLKQKLKAAVNADKLKPYANEWQETKQAKTALKSERDKLEKERAEANATLAKAQNLFEEAKKRKTKDEPSLIETRQRLKDVFQWEVELKEKQEEFEKTLNKHSETMKLLEDVGVLELKASSLLNKGKEKQTKLKTELSSIEISTEERTLYQKALLLCEKYTSLEENEKKLTERLQNAENTKSQSMEKKAQIQKSQENNKEKWKALISDLQTLYEETCSAIRNCESIMLALDGELATAKKHEENLKVKQLAAQLSSQLKPSEPCLVCGSTDHPVPFNDFADDNKINVINELQDGKDSLKSIQLELKHLQQSLETISEKLWSKFGTAAIETATSSDSAVETPVMEKPFNLELIRDLIVMVKGFLQDKLSIENRLDQLVTRSEEQQRELERVLFAEENSVQQLTTIQEDVNSLTDKIEELNGEWKQFSIPFKRDEFEEAYGQFQMRDKRQTEIQKSLEAAVEFLEKQAEELEKAKDEKAKQQLELNSTSQLKELLDKERKMLQQKITENIGDKSAKEQIDLVEKKLTELQSLVGETEETYEKTRHYYLECDKSYHSTEQRYEDMKARNEKAETEWKSKLEKSTFTSFETYREALTEEAVQQNWEQQLTDYDDQYKAVQHSLEVLRDKLPKERITEEQLLQGEKKLTELLEKMNETHQAVGQARERWMKIEQNHLRYQELEKENEKVSELLEQVGKLQSVFRGNAFVEFMAEEQLVHVTRDASHRLSQLTRGRYAIEVDSAGGFVIRDDANGGIKRPVTSLSGGETFLTSLSLALSLSAQIQLRGRFPLQFFFLDEGFGTLDQELLDTVVTALEKVQMDAFAIGVISHVPELKARLTKRLIVEPAEPGGSGTKVRLSEL